MSTAASMLGTYPHDMGAIDHEKLAACIEACVECAQTCTACADACLAEESVAELTQCIRTDLDCADLCEATGRVLSRQTGDNASVTRAVLEACAAACKACGDECDRHSSTTSTAGSAPTRADAVNRHAGPCSRPSGDRGTDAPPPVGRFPGTDRVKLSRVARLAKEALTRPAESSRSRSVTLTG